MNKLMLIACATSPLAQANKASTRLKAEQLFNNNLPESTKLTEIANICSTNTNFLTGIKIVENLHGKEDSLKEKDLMHKILEENNTIDEISLNNIESKNIALINVGHQIKSNAIKGSRHKAYIASILDSKSLTNGILLKTNLKNNAGEIIAIASGIINNKNKLKGSEYTPNCTIDGVIINKNQNIINYNYSIILKKGNYTLINRIHKILASKKINNKIKSVILEEVNGN